MYFTSWYKNGKKKEEGHYKDFLPRVEEWTIWSEDGRVIFGEDSDWDPLLILYVAFVTNYVCTTLVNLWMLKINSCRISIGVFFFFFFFFFTEKNTDFAKVTILFLHLTRKEASLVQPEKLFQ